MNTIPDKDFASDYQSLSVHTSCIPMTMAGSMNGMRATTTPAIIEFIRG
jgi:hypothetical protein